MVSCTFFTWVHTLCQNPRHALMIRSYHLPMGRWHLKSLIVMTCFMLVLLYYTHKMDYQSGSKTKKQDLVVRAAKPYKSPYSRRRHSKLYKDDKTSLSGKSRGNDSLTPIVKKPEKKPNKKSVALQVPRPNESKFTSNNTRLQQTVDNKVVSKNKPHQNVSFSQVTLGKGHNLDTFKDNNKKENKKFGRPISEDSAKNVTNTAVISNQKVVKADSLIQKLSWNQQQDKSVNVFSAVYDNVDRVTQKTRKGASADLKFKILPKPAVKIKRNNIFEENTRKA